MSRRCIRDSERADQPACRSRKRAAAGRPAPTPSAEPAILGYFRRWMTRHRGVVPLTLDTYVRVLRELVADLGEDASRYEAHGLIAFLLRYQSRHGRSGADHAATAMRVFLRHLAAEGKCVPGLDGAIPPVIRRHLSALPRYLRAEQVDLVLATCDTSTAIGLRDRMVLLLLARLGLRGGDVLDLRLQDIDCAAGTLRLGGKGRREVRLPLTQELGDALVAYLERGRPRAPFDHLFLRATPPVGPWAGSNTVSELVARHILRADISSRSRGAHVLRHSAATEMLRQGASLDEIGAVLRHRSRDTTAIYAKVDVNLLKLVAQPWPEVLPC